MKNFLCNINCFPYLLMQLRIHMDIQRKGCGKRSVLAEIALSVAVVYSRGFRCFYTVLGTQVKGTLIQENVSHWISYLTQQSLHIFKQLKYKTQNELCYWLCVKSNSKTFSWISYCIICAKHCWSNVPEWTPK